MLWSLKFRNIILTITISFFCGCTTDMSEINRISSRNELPDIQAKNLEIIYSNNAKIKVRLTTSELNRYMRKSQEIYTEFPKGIKVLFFDANEKVESRLTANYAKYFEEKQLWLVKYDVELINNEGVVLNSEKLFTDEKRQLIYTDRFVRITNQDGSTISGKGGFKSNLNFTEYEFTTVKGEYIIEEYDEKDETE